MRLVLDWALAIICIWQEARGEDYAGKLAVAEVIRNRMRKRYSSDGSVAETVLRPYQFSGFNTGDPNRIVSFRIDDNDPVVKECIQAWNDSEHTDTVKGAVLYYNPSIVQEPKWVLRAKEVARVGQHVFFEPI